MKFSSPASRSVRVERTGWYNKLYVLGDSGIGVKDVEFVATYKSKNNYFNEKGTLEDWQENVADLCDKNPLFQFAIAAAFASVLLTPCDYESFGLHFFGQSSKGKSALGIVAGSVVGGGGKNGFSKQWRSTSNALESTAFEHNDNLLVLDEISQIEPKALSESIYMLFNDQGKGRADKSGDGKKIKDWKILVISNGEQTIESKIREDKNRQQMAGQAVRMVDIEAIKVRNGEPTLFEYVPNNMTEKDFVNLLKTNAKKYFGTAIRVFLEKLVLDFEENIELAKDYAKQAEKLLTEDNTSSQVGRVISHLSIIIAAGFIATDFGILRYDRDCFVNTAKTILEDWINFRGGNDDLEMKKFEYRVVDFIRNFENTRFKQAGKGEVDSIRYNEHIKNTAGYKYYDKDNLTCFIVLADIFTRELLCGLNRKAAMTRLIRNDWIVTRNTGEARDTIKLTVDGEYINVRGVIFKYAKIMDITKTEYDPNDEDDVGYEEREKAKRHNLKTMYNNDDNLF